MSASHNPNPSTPNYADDEAFVDAYLHIHSMSPPSYRYAYLFWILIGLALLFGTVLSQFGSHRTFVASQWNSWALRRRTWRKGSALEAAKRNPNLHQQPYSFPSNAQILSIFILVTVAAVLSFVGPDYIAPSARLWQFSEPATPASNIPLFNAAPPYTISKAWWTVGGRTGILSFALYPLVILFALKTIPFAVLSLPFLLNLHFDKLSWMHRASGWLLWLVVTIHVATWGVQLANDRRGSVSNGPLWVYVWQYTKFIYGIASYLFLSALLITSLPSFRRNFYEPFFVLHVILIPSVLITSALHYPPIAWWCWSALCVWVSERAWRLLRFTWINGYLDFSRQNKVKHPDIDLVEMNRPADISRLHPYSPNYTEEFDVSMYSSREYLATPTSPAQMLPLATRSNIGSSLSTGYALADLLPGRMIRLRLLSCKSFSWAPGQHVHLRIPDVSRFTTHPFTIASVSGTDSLWTDGFANEIVLLIRAKRNFTRQLWNKVSKKSLAQSSPYSPQSGNHGVLKARPVKLRAQVDGPFGSSTRIRWDIHSTLLIITGGSGVSYGLSILEFMCLRLSEASRLQVGDANSTKTKTNRIRFVWLIREFSHLQWASLTIRKCLRLLPPSALQVEVYVANVSVTLQRQFRKHETLRDLSAHNLDRSVEASSHRNSWATEATESDDDSAHFSIPTTPISETDFHPLDYTNFDGDDDTAAPGEEMLSFRVHKEGQMRRRESRRWSKIAGSNTMRLPYHKGSAFKPASSSLGEYQDGSQVSPDYSPYGRSDHPSARPSSNPSSGRNTAHSNWNDINVGAHSSAIEDDDVAAMVVVAEYAKAGKPNLKLTLTEEIERSAGSLGVACCGPTSLNALVRKLVASQLSGGQRNRQGHSGGSISLYSEEFEY